MIDKQSLLEKTDLLALVGGSLKKVATTGGGEWAGSCPFCGGDDRFRVQPYQRPWGLWLCRHCTEGKWQNAIDFVIERDSVDFRQACEILNGGALPRSGGRRSYPKRPELPAYSPPAGDWQAQAEQVIEVCAGNLWAPENGKALEYLHGRGLLDETIGRFRLGYSPGGEIGRLFVPRGILIPCIAAGEVWYLKIRLPAKSGQQKYTCVKGSRTAAIFNADDLSGAQTALFVEGEFDAMIAWQGLAEMLACVTLGSATNLPDLATWGAHLIGLNLILAAYDGDPAGEQGVSKLALLSERVKLAPLPEGPWKDVNDYAQAGGDLWDWIMPYLQAYTSPDRFIATPAELQAAGLSG